MPAALELRGFGLAHRRSGGEDVLLQDVDLALEEHGFYVLVGSSGGGKSSLLRVLAGLQPPTRGETRATPGKTLKNREFCLELGPKTRQFSRNLA